MLSLPPPCRLAPPLVRGKLEVNRATSARDNWRSLRLLPALASVLGGKSSSACHGMKSGRAGSQGLTPPQPVPKRPTKTLWFCRLLLHLSSPARSLPKCAKVPSRAEACYPTRRRCRLTPRPNWFDRSRRRPKLIIGETEGLILPHSILAPAPSHEGAESGEVG